MKCSFAGVLIPACLLLSGCLQSDPREAVPLPREQVHSQPTMPEPGQPATPVEPPPEIVMTEHQSSSVTSEPVRKEAKAIPAIYERLLFFPTKYPHGDWSPLGLAFEDVWFEAEDGTKLHGWYCPCEDPKAVILYAHGNGGHLADRAPLLDFLQSRLQVTVMIFDYRGYGRSAGVPTVEGVIQDAKAARKILAEKAGIPESQIVLLGRSLGGAVVTQLAADVAPRGLILESTFSSLRDVAATHYSKLAWLVPAGKLNSVAAITGIQAPVLISHGTADRTVPYVLGEKLFTAANEPKRFYAIRDGDHNTPMPMEYYQEFDRFLEGLGKE